MNCEMYAVKPTAELPEELGWRRYRQMYDLEPGEAMFVPDTEFVSGSLDPPHVLRTICWTRNRQTGRRYRTKRGTHAAQRGTWICRER